MSEQFEKMRQRVLAEVKKQHSRTPHPNHMKILGHFIAAHLMRKRLSSRDLARSLNLPTLVIDLLLRGDLPEWMLSDAFVIRLAKAIEYEPNVLRVMMGRETAAADPSERFQQQGD
ncbi:hypothetical protein HC928_02975 [bacterium]|nr:hypothetical protein [bacterium]